MLTCNLTDHSNPPTYQLLTADFEIETLFVFVSVGISVDVDVGNLISESTTTRFSALSESYTF